jgi:G3E family GTPase
MEVVSKSLKIYRSKGILNIDGFRRKAIFHGVNNRFTVVWGGEWPKKAPRESEMVFIGRNLDVDFLKAGLQDCLVL